MPSREIDIRAARNSILHVRFLVGVLVYRLGHGPLKAERRVRFPYALPSPLAPGRFFSSHVALALWALALELMVMRHFQIIFNPTSAAELAKMPKELQLEILGEFRGLPQECISTELETFGKLEREGKTLHRFRLGEYRVYFERHDLGVVVHRILSKNSLKDFLFRSKLPTGEDEALQDNPKFWDLIEEAKKTA